MKIAHLCLSNYFIDNVAYQENELVAQNARDGHEVLVVASTENLSPDGKLFYVEPGDYRTPEGARVVRLPYARSLPFRFARKVRAYDGVRALLGEFKPDVMLHHGLSGWSLRTAATFARENGPLPFYADTHSDAFNSGRSFLSRRLLHGLFYRAIVQNSLDDIRKVLCVSVATQEFAHDVYGIPEEKLEFFPLGGKIPSDQEYTEKRAATRLALGLGDDQTLVVQSGKFNVHKKLLQSLRAFRSFGDDSFRFVLCGHLAAEIEPEASRLIAEDPRVIFLGWKNPEELTDILCAADVYLQPGSQSATMQHALCSRCAVVLADVPSHAPYIDGNGWLLASEKDLSSVFEEMARRKDRIDEMGKRSHALAQRLLDYEKLAQRILS